MTTADIVVVGAGAAGIMAATVAAEAGRRVLLLEKSRKPGLKILISGGGRCNLTTTLSGRALEAEYGTRRGRWLRHALRSFQPPALREWVEAEGVALQEEDLDKIFPCSGKAKDVLDAFLHRAQRAGVSLRTEAAVEGVERDGSRFALRLVGGERVVAERLILATGGRSYPKTGATGDGYRFVEALGHSVTPTVPALAPLRIDEPWLNELQGIVVDVPIRTLDPSGRVLDRRHRPVLFTHKGLSGPAPMDLAGSIEEQRLSGSDATVVELDFAPGRSPEQVRDGILEMAQTAPRRFTAQALPDQLPERLRLALVREANAEFLLSDLPKAARSRLVAMIKGTRVACAQSLGFDHAEVTRGGVPLSEVDAKTMASKICPGLFVCGELLDIDGPIGGFNFQAAFATARLAGVHAAATQ